MNIVVDWNSFKEAERELREDLERLMSLPNKNAPTIQKAIARRKEALHQLYEWIDFLKHPEIYENTDRGRRMKEIYRALLDFQKRQRVRKIELALIRITMVQHFREALRIIARRKKKEGKITISANIGIDEWGTINFYYD